MVSEVDLVDTLRLAAGNWSAFTKLGCDAADEIERLREALEKIQSEAQQALDDPHSTGAVFADFLVEIARAALHTEATPEERA